MFTMGPLKRNRPLGYKTANLAHQPTMGARPRDDTLIKPEKRDLCSNNGAHITATHSKAMQLALCSRHHVPVPYNNLPLWRHNDGHPRPFLRPFSVSDTPLPVFPLVGGGLMHNISRRIRRGLKALLAEDCCCPTTLRENGGRV